MESWKRGLLKLISLFEINVMEDYPRVRRAQDLFLSIGARNFDYVDWEVERKDADPVPIRMFPYEDDDQIPGIILYFHGGGWVTGSIDSYTRICGEIAQSMRRTVVSVDYRLAPEHPYPAGLDDCYAVTARLFDHIDVLNCGPRDLVICGDSAGGNLAAAVALRARDEGEFRVERQILFYPSLYADYTSEEAIERFPSLLTYSEGYGLTTKQIRDYMELYVPDPEQRRHPYVAPLQANDWSDLPETLVFTAEFDPLRDEGEAYAERLALSGQRVKLVRSPETIHNFLTLPPISKPVQLAVKEMRAFLDGIVEGEIVERDSEATANV